MAKALVCCLILTGYQYNAINSFYIYYAVKAPTSILWTDKNSPHPGDASHPVDKTTFQSGSLVRVFVERVVHTLKFG